MKRILTLWLAAMIVAVQPCYAVVMVGFGQEVALEFDEGFNFRPASAGTDGADETYVLSADLFPTTRAGVTFGWVSAPYDTRTNAGTDQRLKGYAMALGPTSKTFRVTLPGSGNYRIWLAGGDKTNLRSQRFFIKDDDATLQTISGTVADEYYMDASGTTRTEASWVSSQSYIDLSFSTTAFSIVLSPDADVATVINHLRILKL